MHDIEPFYNWRDFYISEEDKDSPFYKMTYNEFAYTNKIYNYYVHPQWDQFGSETMYIKILFADYEEGYGILELIGEWNDCIGNDIMYLKRDIIDVMIKSGVNKFVLLCEHVLNFHGSDDCYYEEWFQDVEDGWIAAINFRPHVAIEMERFNLDYYMVFGGELDDMNWRMFGPVELFNKIEHIISRRLN